MTDQSGRVRIDSLGATRAGRYTLMAYCNNPECRHRAKLDLDALIGKLGAGHSSLAADLVPKMRCSAYGNNGRR